MTTPEPNIVVEQRAREVLAAEYALEGWGCTADRIRSGSDLGEEYRAIVRALLAFAIEAVEAQKERDAQIAEQFDDNAVPEMIAARIRSTGKAGA